MARSTSCTGRLKSITEAYVMKSDEATFNSDTREATATGHFALDGGPNDDHIRASHGTYNLALETGRFYDVTGTTGLRFRANRVILTSTAPFAFHRQELSTKPVPITTWCMTAPSPPASCLIPSGNSTRAR
jgi:lipopolysaccharide assembly outer membrane protein LptD (OstA)